MAAILISRADGEACICFVFCKVVGARSESTGGEEMARCVVDWECCHAAKGSGYVTPFEALEKGPKEKLIYVTHASRTVSLLPA